MGNTILSSDIIVKEALDILHQNLSMTFSPLIVINPRSIVTMNNATIKQEMDLLEFLDVNWRSHNKSDFFLLPMSKGTTWIRT